MADVGLQRNTTSLQTSNVPYHMPLHAENWLGTDYESDLHFQLRAELRPVYFQFMHKGSSGKKGEGETIN